MPPPRSSGTRGASRRPTSEDVAREAGVSRATVSYVLNRVEHERVSPATRARVLAAAERLGYVPNAAAAALRGGRTSLVLVGIPAWPLGPPLAAAISVLVAELERLGYTSLVHLGQSDDRDGFARACERARPVGVIASSGDLVAARVEDLRSNGTRAVIGLFGDPVADVPALLFDQRSVGQAAMEHLAERGHRRVLALGPDFDAPAIGPLARDRVAGAAATATERGAHLEVCSAACEVDAVGAVILPALRRPDAPTAISAFNDEYALAAMAALGEAGLPIPRRVAVIGCDDSPPARLTRPRLTTIGLAPDTWRDLAFQLHAIVEGAAGVSVIATPQVVEGGTT